MFGLSFSEIMLIGVIALIVIGPEKLPKVARTVGHLLGRAQRYVNDVKTDIRKEMDGTEIGNLKDQMQEAANSVKSSVEEAGKSWRAPLDEAEEALKEASDSIKTLADAAQKSTSLAAEEEAALEAGQDEQFLEATEQDKSLPEAIEQNEESNEEVDTRTLPLPGFEQKQAPVTTPDNSSHTDKGAQP